MPFKGIYTIRDTPQPSHWDIVFEWEDAISTTLNIPLVPVGKAYDNIYKPALITKLLNRANGYQVADRLFFRPDHYFLAFHIGPPGVYSFHSRCDVIPVIIDFWANEELSRFERIFRYSKAVVITSREAFCYLQKKKVDLPLHHVALSIPDKYLSIDISKKRDIDLIQIGRRNQRLDEFARRYTQEFPRTHYVVAERHQGGYRMVSNIFGDMGTFADRAGFIALLSRSKISLVSAPGMDDDRVRTGGFSPVTPRFLESCASGCHLIATYPNNEDFKWYEMSHVVQPVTDYQSFRDQATKYLSEDSLPDYSVFLSKHVTSIRAKQLSILIE